MNKSSVIWLGLLAVGCGAQEREGSFENVPSGEETVEECRYYCGEQKERRCVSAAQFNSCHSACATSPAAAVNSFILCQDASYCDADCMTNLVATPAQPPVTGNNPPGGAQLTQCRSGCEKLQRWGCANASDLGVCYNECAVAGPEPMTNFVGCTDNMISCDYGCVDLLQPAVGHSGVTSDKYLDELTPTELYLYCEYFVGLLSASGIEQCSEIYVGSVEECASAPPAALPHCTMPEVETCIETLADQACSLSAPPVAECGCLLHGAGTSGG